MNEIEKLLNQKKATDRKQRKITLLVVSVSVVCLLIIFYIITTTKSENRSLIQKVDSVSKQLVKDSSSKRFDTIAFKEQQEMLSKLLRNYIEVRNKYLVDSLDKFYDDTLYRYFKNFSNVPKNIVTQYDKEHWKLYRDEQFTIQDTIKVLLDSTGYQAFIKGEECDPKCKQELWEFHFGKNNKINYLRAIFSKTVTR
jgi:hypothetical protein